MKSLLICSVLFDTFKHLGKFLFQKILWLHPGAGNLSRYHRNKKEGFKGSSCKLKDTCNEGLQCDKNQGFVCHGSI